MRGSPLTVTDPNSKVTTAAYDKLGRLVKVWRPGHLTSGTPDSEFGYSVTKTAPSYTTVKTLGPNGNQITSYAILDGQLRPRQTQTVTEAGGRMITDTQYDIRGLTAKTSEFNNASTPASTLVTFNDVDVVRQTRYVYDGAGRTRFEQLYKNNVLSLQTETRYQGDRVGVIPPAGGTPVQDLYDGRGQVIEKRLFSGTPFSGAFIRALYTYDGRTAVQILGAAGSRVRLMSYYGPATRRLTDTSVDRETSPSTFATKYTTAYLYDDAGNLTSAAGTTDGAADQEECFTYDYLGRLTKAWTQTSGTCTTPQRTGADPYWREWTFDNIGNRLSQVDKNPGPGDTTWTYQVGSAGAVKPHQVKQITSTGPLATPTRTYGYDNAGNTTAATTATGTAQTLTWDKENHLATLVDAGNTTSYVYDPDGGRLIARTPTTTTVYLPDGTELAMPTGGGTVTGTRYYGPIAVRTAAGLTWTCTNHQGTSTVQIDATTLTATRRRLLPYGENRTTPPPWIGTKGYVDGTTDNTSLTHLGAREYDPTTGRFISIDPIQDLTDPRQWHAYSYANNTPVTSMDPKGLRPTCDEEGGGVHLCANGEGGYRYTPPKRQPKPAPPSEVCGPLTPEYCHPEGSRREGPYDILKKWAGDLVAGLLPKNACGIVVSKPCADMQYFRDRDVMTILLIRSDAGAYVYLEIQAQLEAGATEGRADFHYSTMPKREVLKHFAMDVLSDTTLGVFGSDPIEAVTGSFDVDWKVVGYDGEGRPVVEIHAQNATTLYSGTRIPVLTPSRGDGMAGSGADAYGGDPELPVPEDILCIATEPGREAVPGEDSDHPSTRRARGWRHRRVGVESTVDHGSCCARPRRSRWVMACSTRRPAGVQC